MEDPPSSTQSDDSVETIREDGGSTHCCACRQDLQTVDALREHLLKVHLPESRDNPAKPYQCDRCFRRYFNKYTLKRHKQLAVILLTPRPAEEPLSSEDFFRCCGCRQDFSSADDLKRHSEETHLKSHQQPADELQRPFQCEVCFKRFVSQPSLRRHRKDRFSNRRTYQDRKLSATRCCGCGEQFDSLQQLQAHSQSVHEPDRMVLGTGEVSVRCTIECTICYNRFSSHAVYRRHRLLLDADQLRHCPECAKPFLQLRLLRAHVRRFHPALRNQQQQPSQAKGGHQLPLSEGNYLCTVCGRSFLTKSTLDNHEKVHNPHPDEFRCTVCEKRFSSKGNLHNHTVRFHTGTAAGTRQQQAPPCVCAVCGESFKTPNYLETHARRHTGEKPFQCKDCGKRFAHSSAHQRHRQVHDTARPTFCCERCGKTFTSQSGLVIHEKSHSTDVATVRVVCDVCGKTFLDARYMRKHRKLQHGDSGMEKMDARNQATNDTTVASTNAFPLPSIQEC
ncbi:zinc finger protein OZF-like [Anopheles albimanus]|uniref:zinc finger protein OZF-like n=1 Tax=Anopheles albimanus TaxID=7167 RepID=UPI00164217DE|nr:zinc finger protein OZF-like [Anopheles albimanus]